MTPARLEACYFEDPAGEFVRLARVLEASAARWCAEWDRSIVRLGRSRVVAASGVPSHEHNTHKFEHWAAVVREAPEGQRLLLLDADTVIVQPIDDIWDRDFEFAYTVKTPGFPFNLGCLFLRVTPAVRAFFEAWRTENARLLATPGAHRQWRYQFGGINQASFGMLRDAGALAPLAAITLPCEDWNCEESGWVRFDPGRVRILHVKGALRRAIFRRGGASSITAKALVHWRELEAALTVRAVSA